MSSEEQLYQALLDRHFAFYEELRLQRRRPKTKAQREFQDAAWGAKEPETDHEKAYVWHLKRTVGWHLKSPTHYAYRFAESWEFGKKWDDAGENMKDWRS